MSGAKILLLEDDDDLRQSLTELLEDQGFTVLAARDSAEAVAWAQAVQRLDLVVTDVRMTGPDGLTTLTLLRELQPDLRSVVITGFASLDAPVRAIQVEASDYLHKPVSVGDFVEVVTRVLSSEETKRAYQELLNQVSSHYNAMLPDLGQAQREQLEKDRHRLFQAFYVGLRSRHLNELAAGEIWRRVELLELLRAELSTSPAPEVGLRLSDGYHDLMDRIADHGLAESRATPEERTRFAAIYRKLMDGTLSLEELKVVASLRGLTPEELGRSPELQQLYQRVW